MIDVPSTRRAKKAIKTAFKVQLAGLGFSMVELLSTCSTNWHMSVPESRQWIKDKMTTYYPLGEFKVADGVKEL